MIAGVGSSVPGRSYMLGRNRNSASNRSHSRWASSSLTCAQAAESHQWLATHVSQLLMSRTPTHRPRRGHAKLFGASGLDLGFQIR